MWGQPPSAVRGAKLRRRGSREGGGRLASRCSSPEANEQQRLTDETEAGTTVEERRFSGLP